MFISIITYSKIKPQSKKFKVIPDSRIFIKEQRDFFLKRIIKINPFFFFNNIFIFKPMQIYNTLFFDNKYFIQQFLFFKIRKHLLFIKNKLNKLISLKLIKKFISKNSWKNLNNIKNYNNLDTKWISIKFFYWFLNYYKIFLILLIKIFYKLWILFIYSFHFFNVNLYFKQYTFLYYSKNFVYKQNSYNTFTFFFKNIFYINNINYFLYKKYNNYSFIQNILSINNLNLNIRLDSLRYYPKYLKPFGFRSVFRRFLKFKRLHIKKRIKFLKHYEWKKIDRVWKIWKKFGKGKWRYFDNWNIRDKRVIKYFKDNPLPKYKGPIKDTQTLNRYKKLYNWRPFRSKKWK